MKHNHQSNSAGQQEAGAQLALSCYCITSPVALNSQYPDWKQWPSSNKYSFPLGILQISELLLCCLFSMQLYSDHPLPLKLLQTRQEGLDPAQLFVLLPLGRSLTALPHSHSPSLLLAHHLLQAQSSLVAL